MNFYAIDKFKENYPEILNGYIEKGYSILFNLPEDRCAIGHCRNCNGNHFVFFKKDSILAIRCIFCGSYINTPRKKANVGKVKRANAGNYAFWARRVRENYNGMCAFCNETEDLEVHHIIPYSIDPSLVLDENNGILLCKRHHKMAHGAYSVWRR